MAEYYAVLSKAVSGLTESAEARRKVYDKARNALIGQLKAIDPPLPTAEISRQRLELEEAIRRVEREAAAAAVSSGPKAPRRPPPPPEPEPEPHYEDRGRGYDDERAGGYDDREPGYADERAPSPGEQHGEVFRRAIDEAGRRPRETAVPPADPEPAEAPYQPPAGSAYRVPDPDYYGAPEAETAPEPPPARARTYAAPRVTAAQHGRDQAWDQDGGPALAAAPPSDPFADEPGLPEPPGRRGRMRDRDRDEDLLDRPVRRSRLPAVLLTLLVLAMLGGLGALAWSQRDVIDDVLASFDQAGGSASPTLSEAPRAGGLSEPPKAGDRLLDGGDTADVRVVGPQPDDVPAETAAPPDTALAPDGGDLNALVAQRATLYEEPLNGDAASGVIAIDADVTWSFNGSGPSGAEVVADLRVPDRNLDIRLSIRKNTDETLPASHLAEIVAQGSVVAVSQVPRLVFKATEDGRGQPLVGAAANVAEGFFWIALSAIPEDVTFNLGLIREREWIDLPLVYENGQRAILTFEKGTPGARVFQQALAAWGG